MKHAPCNSSGANSHAKTILPSLHDYRTAQSPLHLPGALAHVSRRANLSVNCLLTPWQPTADMGAHVRVSSSSVLALLFVLKTRRAANRNSDAQHV